MIQKWKKDGRIDNRDAIPLEPCSYKSSLHKSYATALIIALQLAEKKLSTNLNFPFAYITCTPDLCCEAANSFANPCDPPEVSKEMLI